MLPTLARVCDPCLALKKQKLSLLGRQGKDYKFANREYNYKFQERK